MVLLATAVLVMGGAYLVDRPAAGKAGTSAIDVGPGEGPAPMIGTAAHAFTATAADGRGVSLSAYKGQPVWLTFGASWCAACQSEAPDIEAAYKRFKAQGIAVLAVSISEDSATAKDYADRVGLTYPQIADLDTKIASAYRVSGIPAHFFIDKAGILRSVKTGGLSPDQMNSALAEIAR